MIRTKAYYNDIEALLNLPLEWDKLKGQTILITGASGMVGTLLIDVLMEGNAHKHFDSKIIAIGRNKQNLEERFSIYKNNSYLELVIQDINLPFQENLKVDYMIHAASNTHPVAYSLDSIGTITTNVIGTYNLLELAQKSLCKRVVLLSSVEIYGENRGDTDVFDESYCGYIDCNTLRAGYPESKRMAESLCNAYAQKYGLEFVIGRLSRLYGPTMKMDDTKAISQFILNGAKKQDIVLKSKGQQLYSYCYVVDAVQGILCILLNGQAGEAYNIADSESIITLKALASTISDLCDTKVVFELPSDIETQGFSKAMIAAMSSEKIEKLGWKAQTNLVEGLKKTLEMIIGRM